MARDMNTNIRSLYGVGPSRAAAYARLGIYSTGDLFTHFPARYENRGDLKLLCDCEYNQKSAVLLTVATEPKVTMKKAYKSLQRNITKQNTMGR